MGRRKKKRPPELGRVETSSTVGTSFRDLLRDIDLEPPTPNQPTTDRPTVAERLGSREAEVATEREAPRARRPSEGLRGEERTLFYEAMRGVRPIARQVPQADAPARRPARTPPSGEEAAARARLAALVADGVRFEIERPDLDLVHGLKVGAPPASLVALRRRRVAVEAELDLHGLLGDEASQRVVRFVREAHRRGRRRLAIVHGKGLHSEGGISVLRERTIEALTRGGAAPLVRAFATAPAHLGGTGALVVELEP